MTDQIVREAADELHLINPKIGDRFVTVSRKLAALDSDQLAAFADDCLVVADSGWRSFEPLNTLLDIAGELPAERLLQTSRCCRQLSGYSYEPVQAYLDLVSEHLINNKVDKEGYRKGSIKDDQKPVLDDPATGHQLEQLESLGLSLHQQYQHASSLISAYFRSASDVLGIDDQDAWCQLVEKLAVEGRDPLQAVFNLTAECPGWHTPLVLAEHSSANCLAYLQKARSLSVSYLNHFDSIDSLLEANAAMAEMSKLLATLADLAVETESERELILQEALGLPFSDAVLAFLQHASSLPLNRPSVVRNWISYGVSETADNPAALVAYLSRESMRSQEALKRYRGEVCLADHQRTFDLLAEALSARQLTIEATGEVYESESFRHDKFVSLGADARTIYLPETVNLFDSEDDNFAFYKVSIFHQIGFVEFGCFDAISRVEENLEAYADEKLARKLFQIIEDARIDWQLEHRYPGLAPHLRRLKNLALWGRTQPLTIRVRLMEVLVRTGLDQQDALFQEAPFAALEQEFKDRLLSLSAFGATIDDALKVTAYCYRQLADLAKDSQLTRAMSESDVEATLAEMPEPVSFRGEMEVSEVARSMKIDALVEALEEEAEILSEETGVQMPGSPDEQMEIGDLQAGEVTEGVSMILEELQKVLEGSEDTPDVGDGKGVLEFLGGLSSRSSEASRHRYDEWDHVIADYRSGWCTLHEYRDLEEDRAYFRKTLLDNQDLSQRIRHQLNKVRPEMLRKVKGVIEGEELDLERSIAYVVDRKAGLTPDETIYVQRQRKERDVSTLFLLDMSASTDDIVPDPDLEPPPAPDIDDDDEYLMQYFERHKAFESEARRIIDLEKASVILMADALESLGDAYSVCGFSGYGREQVDYYLCKDFDEPFNGRVQGKIGGIKPCRSTRMGAPIRHATRRLMETGSRIKALIIISDGYPQDHDYGSDRNSREYGLNDTMKALSEAKQQGVLSYCLTVDPSGHDYLRAMCPDSQYMVIQDINQLPEELSRVYRSLTG